jgi:hypothetical protein
MDGCPRFGREMRLLEYLDIMALVAQSDGCCQATNPSANN